MVNLVSMDSTFVRIALTPAQKRVVEWALDSDLETFYQTNVDDGELDAMPPLPYLDGDVLVAQVGYVLDDLYYRCCEQYRAMADDGGIEEQLAKGRDHQQAQAWLMSQNRVLDALAVKFRAAGATS